MTIWLDNAGLPNRFCKFYKKILKKFPNINLTTGGGIRNFKDLNKLKEIGVHNAIFGRAYYEGKISIDDIKSFIKK